MCRPNDEVRGHHWSESGERPATHLDIPRLSVTFRNRSQRSYAPWVKQSERLLAIGLLIAAATVMTTYYLGFVAISVAFPVASVLAVAGGVGLGGSKRRSKPRSI